MKTKKNKKNIWRYYFEKVNRFICYIDRQPLIWSIIPLMVLFFSYYFLLGKDCVIEINDQLDETLFTYILNAKYMFSGVDTFPEMLNGVPRGGMTVSGWIFVPLYRFFSTYQAFMIQFVIVACAAFLGMYLLVKELADSSIISLICAAMFMFLPYQPVYGLSLMGGPLVFWAFFCLYQRKKIIGSYLAIIFFGLSANLVLLGYVVLGFVVVTMLVIVPSRNKYMVGGFLTLLFVYVLTNVSLFIELFIGNSYVSHREEMVVSGAGFASAWDVFCHSAQHAPTFHEKLIFPIVLVILGYGISYKKLKDDCKKIYSWLLTIFILNIFVALFYGFCQSSVVVDFRNSVSGFLHYFSAYRVYWIYPTTWYTMVGLAAGLIWKQHKSKVITGFLIMIVLIPTAWDIYQGSNWILNRSQYNNNCNVGLRSWNDYFAEDVMALIKDDIRQKTGREQSEYKVASLGMCPATALHSGFYCIDGYSNNYSLDYKHEFREIIEKELDKCPNMQTYFDAWGSRCYLFTEESQNYYYRHKNDDFVYKNLELNTEKMKEMECEYLFSAAEIDKSNARELGLILYGTFETQESDYRVWVYEVE